MPNSLRLDTNLAYAKGAYTVTLEFGSRRDKANLLLDKKAHAKDIDAIRKLTTSREQSR